MASGAGGYLHKSIALSRISWGGKNNNRTSQSVEENVCIHFYIFGEQFYFIRIKQFCYLLKND